MRYPQQHIVFLLLIWLDVASHWLQMYSTLAKGAKTHKAHMHMTLLHVVQLGCNTGLFMLLRFGRLPHA